MALYDNSYYLNYCFYDCNCYYYFVNIYWGWISIGTSSCFLLQLLMLFFFLPLLFFSWISWLSLYMANSTKFQVTEMVIYWPILVPRGRAPFGQHQKTSDSRTSRHSAHVQRQVWRIWLVLASIYCVYKAIQKRNVVGPVLALSSFHKQFWQTLHER